VREGDGAILPVNFFATKVARSAFFGAIMKSTVSARLIVSASSGVS
jgi:hypothetical protein